MAVLVIVKVVALVGGLNGRAEDSCGGRSYGGGYFGGGGGGGVLVSRRAPHVPPASL